MAKGVSGGGGGNNNDSPIIKEEGRRSVPDEDDRRRKSSPTKSNASKKKTTNENESSTPLRTSNWTTTTTITTMAFVIPILILLFAVVSDCYFHSCGMHHEIQSSSSSSSSWKRLALSTFAAITSKLDAIGNPPPPPLHPWRSIDTRQSPSSILFHSSSSSTPQISNITLREYLTHPSGFHLAMAPAFFGFYAYFGALTALEDELKHLRSASGASAGAMAAVLLGAGIHPRDAAEYVSSLGLTSFADPIGVGGVLKGDKFEAIMRSFIIEEQQRRMEGSSNETTSSTTTLGCVAKHEMGLRMEDAKIPVAVTTFDLLSLREKILTEGCMARAARASATFPFLFQPAAVYDYDDNRRRRRWFPTSLLVDGGITDHLGLNGLSALPGDSKRVVNFVVGSMGVYSPPGPSGMPPNANVSEVLSISLKNTPRCGPWAMKNGPKAVEVARRAMEAVLDVPLYRGGEEGHYELHIDASMFVVVGVGVPEG